MENPILKYRELIDQIKRTSVPENKIDLLATMVFTMATNDNRENREEHRRMSRDIRKIKNWGLKIVFIVACLIIFLIALNPKLAPLFSFLKVF